MCFPIAAAIGPIIGMASSAASAAVGFANQQQQYSEESKQYAQNVTNAEQDARTSYERLNAQEMENNQQYAEKSQLNVIDAAQKQSSVVASAATSGVSGNVVTGLVNEIGTSIGMKGAELSRQWQATADQAEGEKTTATEQETSRIDAIAPPVAPNPAGAIIGGIGGGLKFAGSLFKDSGFFGNAPSSSASDVNVTPSSGGGGGGIGSDAVAGGEAISEASVPLGQGGIGMM